MAYLVNVWDEAQQKYVGIPALRGEPGPQGPAGAAPSTQSIVDAVLAALPDGDEVRY